MNMPINCSLLTNKSVPDDESATDFFYSECEKCAYVDF